MGSEVCDWEVELKKREASRVFIGSNEIFFLIRLSKKWLVKKNVDTDFPGQLEAQL